MSGSLYPNFTKELQNISAKIERIKKGETKRMDGKPEVLTDNEKRKWENYQQGLKSPTLPKGVVTMVKKWYTQETYKRRKNFSNKYTEKGIKTEDEAIQLIGRVFDLGYVVKNEKRITNSYMTGEMDLIKKSMGLIIDNKSSYDCFTFPILEEKIDIKYWWQLQGYMILAKMDLAMLVYTLMDMPEDMIQRECWQIARLRGDDEVTFELYEEVKALRTYSNLPDDLRVKGWSFKKKKGLEKEIKLRVKLANELLKSINITNIVEIDDENNVVEKHKLSSYKKEMAA